MTRPEHHPVRSALTRPVWLVRRAVAPASLELEGRLPELLGALERLSADNEDLRRANAELRDADAHLSERLREAEERTSALAQRADELAEQVRRLHDQLHEERRLHLRVAEIADLVTELVLPLHDREVDAAALQRLRPDTL